MIGVALFCLGLGCLIGGAVTQRIYQQLHSEQLKIAQWHIDWNRSQSAAWRSCNLRYLEPWQPGSTNRRVFT